MFSNVLAATLRNLMRNRLYAAISIGGLAIGMAVAILTGLYVRDELTFDHFIPGDRNIYVLVNHFDVDGLRGYSGQIPPEMAAPFKLDFPQAKTVVRYGPEKRTLTRGQVEVNDDDAWVDPDFFDLFRFKTLAGDLQAAMRRPDGWGWWALQSWLHGFSAHVALSPWFFVASAGAALLIATLTVLAHTLRVAAAKPVGALRYE